MSLEPLISKVARSWIAAQPEIQNAYALTSSQNKYLEDLLKTANKSISPLAAKGVQAVAWATVDTASAHRPATSVRVSVAAYHLGVSSTVSLSMPKDVSTGVTVLGKNPVKGKPSANKIGKILAQSFLGEVFSEVEKMGGWEALDEKNQAEKRRENERSLILTAFESALNEAKRRASALTGIESLEAGIYSRGYDLDLNFQLVRGSSYRASILATEKDDGTFKLEAKEVVPGMRKRELVAISHGSASEMAKRIPQFLGTIFSILEEKITTR